MSPDVSAVTETARAKVNLYLRVLDREPSGYHRLWTVFCALELADDLHVAITHYGAGDIVLHATGADPGPATENLAYRAAKTFLREAGLSAGVEIRLNKRIPAGAGLGGGSSDAAAALRALDRIFPGALPAGRLHAIGAELGSDVPFFLQPSPLAWGEGRGERLTPLPALDSRPVVLVIPPFPVATIEAYGWLDRDREEGGLASAVGGASPGEPAGPDDARDAMTSWSAIARWAVNDFEPPVFARHGGLGEMKAALAATAALAMLSGSGSTVFGVFDARSAADAAASALQRLDPSLRVVRTRTRSS